MHNRCMEVSDGSGAHMPPTGGLASPNDDLCSPLSRQRGGSNGTVACSARSATAEGQPVDQQQEHAARHRNDQGPKRKAGEAA